MHNSNVDIRMSRKYLRNRKSLSLSPLGLPITNCPGTGEMKNRDRFKTPKVVHYLRLEFDEQPREQWKLLVVHEFVLDRI